MRHLAWPILFSLLAVTSPGAFARELPASFAPVLKKVLPSVVNIAGAGRDDDASEPATVQELMRRQTGDLPHPRSLGSGFILTADGDIVTNHHVVQGNDRVRVRLSADEEYEARVIGSDERTDLALLRISAARPLPTLPLGDSDALEVGDWVLALGNPFAIGGVASAGIIGAKGRWLGISAADDVLETDAPVSPLCSGGPLVDLEGRVVGVTVAALTPAGTAAANGLAIPINLAGTVIAQLRERGRVVRGSVGVTLQPVTPELAPSFGLPAAEGALVADLDEDGAAARAGIQRGDVIVRWGTTTVIRPRELLTLIAATPPGTVVPVTLRRDGKERTVEVTVGEVPRGGEEPEPERPAADAGTREWGFAVRPLSDREARRRGLKPGTGMTITDVEELTPADDAGLEPGDIVVQVNRVPVHTIAEIKKALATKPDHALLLVRRGTASIYVELER